MFKFALIGLGLGGIYALATMGLVLVYRGSGVLNFAQGAIAAFGAFAFYELQVNAGLPTPVALPGALVLCALFGVLMHFGVMRPLITAPPLARVIATLGVMAVIQAAGHLRYGSEALIVPSLLPTSPVNVFGSNVGRDRLALFALACVTAAVLWAAYRFTRFGLATTAVAENEQTAQLNGHSPNRIALINWMLGCVLAGVAGILLAPITGLVVDNLVLLIVPMLAAGLVAGFTSFPIMLGAAVVMGIVQSEMAFYIAAPGWSQSVPFLLVMLILVLRGRALPVRSHINERLPDVGSGLTKPRVLVPLIAALVVVILVHPDTWSAAVTTSLLMSAIGVSVVIVTGYAGQLSLAQFALAGISGLVATRLSATQGMPFLLTVVCGTAAAVVVGFLVGLPALRTRGINLAVITFGLAFAMQSVVFEGTMFTGGINGTVVEAPSVFGLSLDYYLHPRRYEVAALVVFLLALLIGSNVRRGRAGRRLIAVRSNERAAASLGISVARAKLFGFAVAAGVAGLAGPLIAFQNTYVNYPAFNVFGSVNVIISGVLGGVGYLWGALISGVGAIGGVIPRIVNVFSESGDVGLVVALVLGLFLVLTLIFNPDGVASFMARGGKVGQVPMRSSGKGARGAQPPTEPEEDERAAAPTVAAVALRAPKQPVTPRRLVVEGLTVRFGGVVALEDVSLTVDPGRVVGLMGPNGAGKTTLIDAVTGFVTPSAGSVHLDDVRLDGKSAARRASLGMSRTLQSLELFEEMTVADNIRVAIEAAERGVYLRDLVWPRRSALTPAAAAAIEVLGLAGDLERVPGELPLGRRRLVAIARAIAAEPSVLLLDEPAAGLDERETEELGVLIRALAGEWGLAILLVEHDVPLLMRTCDSLVAIDHGRYVTSGDPQTVRHHPRVVEAYLGMSRDDQDDSHDQHVGSPS